MTTCVETVYDLCCSLQGCLQDVFQPQPICNMMLQPGCHDLPAMTYNHTLFQWQWNTTAGPKARAGLMAVPVN